jgi:hypothetical protein
VCDRLNDKITRIRKTAIFLAFSYVRPRQTRGLNIHVELLIVGVGRTSHFRPAIALIFLLMLIVWLVGLWMITSIHLVLVIVMVELISVALHQVARDVFWGSLTQRGVLKVHQEVAFVDDFCAWKEGELKT